MNSWKGIICPKVVNHLYREIKYHTHVELLKGELHSRFDWCPREAFELVDSYGDGYISTDSIQKFLLINGYKATPLELDAIMRRLDTDSDCVLNMSEFMNAFRLRDTR